MNRRRWLAGQFSGQLEGRAGRERGGDTKLREKAGIWKHHQRAQANVIRNQKFNHLKEKERLT